jgi:hypothetical protein
MGIAVNCSDLHISAFEGSSRLLLESMRRNEDPEVRVDQYMGVQASQLLSVKRLHAASPFDISHLCMGCLDQLLDAPIGCIVNELS